MGPELTERMKKQCERFGAEFIMDEITEIDLSKRPFRLKPSIGETIEADAVIIATGAIARLLGLENESRLMGYGVSACATCDGFFFQKVPVTVIGGGDSAMEEATFLTKFASKVTIVHRREHLKASKIMQQRAFDNPKIDFIYNAEMIDVLGKDKVTGIRMRDTKTGEERDLETSAVFLAIGHVPSTSVFKGQIDMDENGYIKTAADCTYTSVEGVYACGDVQDTVYRQAITAAGSGCMAALDAERWLEGQG